MEQKGEQMKCPFRTASVVKHFDRLDSVVVKQEFAECYGSECPYYFPPRTENGIIYHEECKKVAMEEATLHGERRDNNAADST